jgi:GT2 family glycosyltransferase
MDKMNICTVVVTYNRLELLKGAIEALRGQSLCTDILIVNNGSTDGTKEFLDNQTDITVIHQSNVGGAGGFYTGLKYACEHGYDCAWIMDDDVLPDKDALKNLIEKREYLINNGESVGYVCSRVTDNAGESVNVPLVDSRPDEKTGYANWPKYVSKGIVKVQLATFVSVLIPCRIVYELGLPYKEFFIWGDDTEYTYRISNKYPSYMIAESVVKHLRAGNGKPPTILTMDNPQRICMLRYQIRNTHFLDRKLSRVSLAKRILTYLKEICLAMKFLIKGEFLKTRTLLNGCMKGLLFNPKIEFPRS